MIGNFLAVDEAVILEQLEDPARISDLLYEGADAGIERRHELSIDKAWHGIHFLLTGIAWGGEPPLNFILGGQPIGAADVGYGPARAFDATRVADIARALEAIPVETFREHFDSEALSVSVI